MIDSDYCSAAYTTLIPMPEQSLQEKPTNFYQRDIPPFSTAFTLAHAGHLASRLPLRLSRLSIELFMPKQPQLLEMMTTR